MRFFIEIKIILVKENIIKHKAIIMILKKQHILLEVVIIVYIKEKVIIN